VVSGAAPDQRDILRLSDHRGQRFHPGLADRGKVRQDLGLLVDLLGEEVAVPVQSRSLLLSGQLPYGRNDPVSVAEPHDLRSVHRE
jgi:hypothetical protein